MDFTSGVYVASLVGSRSAFSASGNSPFSGRSSIFLLLLLASFRRPLTLTSLLLGVGIRLGSGD